jgi:integrase
MGSIRIRNDLLFFDFRYQGERCREQTLLEDTPANRKKLQVFMDKIDVAINRGDFQYADFFPGSKILERLKAQPAPGQAQIPAVGYPSVETPIIEEFAEEWLEENLVRWKRSYQETIRGSLDKHLLPYFGEMAVSHITKSDILKFRSSLAKVLVGKKVGLSPSRINHVMTTLRMILNDAADRYQFNTPFRGIKPLKVPKTDVHPFTLEEVNLILEGVRDDFQNYYRVRFFTAMRTGEIDGLKWDYVNFDRREILIRETLVEMREEVTKTPGSVREIQMSEPVYQALKAQWELTGGKSNFVFCNRNGNPFNHSNITKRIWHPTLKLLGLKRRRPYQSRHTMATLWLASGENPEWIARQMGHTSTEMLFTVYSRFVPNLTHRDGSAFERLLVSQVKGESDDK